MVSLNPTYSQNFISNPSLLKDLLNITTINKNDLVLDIGAGLGDISIELAEVCRKVVAYEIDNNLYISSYEILSKFNNIELHHENFLNSPLPDSEYKVFSNIPFNQSSFIINKLFFTNNQPLDTYLFLQKETALRLMGNGEGLLISLLLLPFFEISIIHTFKRTDFNPIPNVDVVLLGLLKRKQSLIENKHYEDYKDFISYIIKQQKPTLKIRLNKIFTNLQLSKIFKINKIGEQSTCYELPIEKWVAMFNYFNLGVSEEKKDLIKGSYKQYQILKDKQPKVFKTRT